MAEEPFLDASPELGDTSSETGLQGTHTPTLLIGLGGTGAEVLLRVKKQLRDRGRADEGLHRFLFIDTDSASFSTREGLPAMDVREKCPVGIDPDTAGEFLSTTGDPNRFPALKRRFPDEHLSRSLIAPPNREHGQSPPRRGCRPLTAFAVALEADTVRRKMETALDDLRSLSSWVKTASNDRSVEVRDRVNIYVVGSLAGATGSGTLLDVALMAKDVCAAHDPTLTGMFALPGAFNDLAQDSTQRAHHQANTYAALNELQFCLDAGRDEREEMGPIEFHYDSPAAPDLELAPRDRLFDLCLLVDNQNTRGKLSNIEEFYGLMARSLFQYVGTRFGESADSYLTGLPVMMGISKCPQTNLDRRFGTISTSVLSYPATRVAEYCTYRTAESVVQDHLIGPAPAEETLRTRLSDFLDQHDLDNRGGANQLLERLLRTESPRSLDPAPERGEPISQDHFSLALDYGEDLGVEAFARQIQGEWHHFSGTTRPEIDALVDQNRRHRTGADDSAEQRPLREAVEDLALSAAAEHGARAAKEILEMLEEVATQMRTEFRRESDEWTERKAWLTQEFVDNTDELAEVGTIKALFTSEDERLKTHLIELYRELVEGALREAARPAALQVLEMLLAEARDVASRWERLLSKLTRLRKTLRESATERETHRGQTGAVVERAVTRPGHERRYYRENGLSSEDAFSAVLYAYEDASNRRADLFRNALQQDVMEFAEDVLIDPLYDHIKDPIFDTSVAEFALNHPEEVVGDDWEKNALKQMLDAQAELCQPFWPASTLGPIEFDEFKGISASVDHVEDDGTLVYSPGMDEWMDAHGFRRLPSTNEREIVLTRLTVGARAFYLRPCEDWKSTYDQVDAKNEYMMQVHPALQDIPDLFPDSE